MTTDHSVERVDRLWSRVAGQFYRAVDPEHRGEALKGAHLAGRYSPTGRSTLYLSSSREGVAAAMVAHQSTRSALVLVTVEVHASRIVDLRDRAACQAAGVDLEDAVAPWQEVLKAGGEPSSWRVRRQLDAIGANGLIDPSRKSPGLWHLTLFQWNRSEAPTVSVR